MKLLGMGKGKLCSVIDQTIESILDFIELVIENELVQVFFVEEFQNFVLSPGASSN